MLRMVAARPGLHVIYMSARSREGVERDGPIESWAVFLGKPFTPARLSEMVRQLIGSAKELPAIA